MLIKFENFEIASDSRQYILKEKLRKEKGSKEQAYQNHYFADFENLVKYLLELKLRRSDVTTVKEMRELLRNTERDLIRQLDM